jgi:hypothetical protein
MALAKQPGEITSYKVLPAALEAMKDVIPYQDRPNFIVPDVVATASTTAMSSVLPQCVMMASLPNSRSSNGVMFKLFEIKSS